MHVQGWMVELSAVLWLISIPLWAVPWSKFSAGVAQTRRVDPLERRRAVVRIGIGALCSGFLLSISVLTGQAISDIELALPLVLLELFIITIGFALLTLSAFLIRTFTIRAKYGIRDESHTGR